nr:uncharacterized protein LOC111834534 isoform X2 [Paramormyrops kingsleyae]
MGRGRGLAGSRQSGARSPHAANPPHLLSAGGPGPRLPSAAHPLFLLLCSRKKAGVFRGSLLHSDDRMGRKLLTLETEDAVAMGTVNPPVTHEKPRRWEFNGEDIAIGSDSECRLTEGNLLINSPEPTRHGGIYQCIASNPPPRHHQQEGQSAVCMPEVCFAQGIVCEIGMLCIGKPSTCFDMEKNRRKSFSGKIKINNDNNNTPILPARRCWLL